MKQLLTGVVLAVAALSANAQLSFSGGANTTFTGVYNPVPNPTGAQTQGRENPTISASPLGGVLSATLLGFEALDRDTFMFNIGPIGTLVNTGAGATAPGTTISGTVGPGPLSFTFTDTTQPASVGNGGTPSVGSASFVILGSFGSATGPFTPFLLAPYDFVLGFNDGLGVDRDFDDLVIGIRLNPIPEPETYALLLAGLGAIGFIARRRQKHVS